MRNEIKNPGCGGGRKPGETSEVKQMSLSEHIKVFAKSQYFRRLVVRAIEDFIILFLLFAAVWSLAFVAGGALKILGVG